MIIVSNLARLYVSNFISQPASFASSPCFFFTTTTTTILSHSSPVQNTRIRDPFFVRRDIAQPPIRLSTATSAKQPLTSISSIIDILNILFFSPSPTHARRGIAHSATRPEAMQGPVATS
ncbi:hypothetical protein TARUN_10047 [Trichoderma arundinaceum]|uniref:Uncharacterized protein n=1 Tax=Trichoderma arundinaceum TaxID=490622 RepID=A0A395N7V5_TRIAR|nr:hypothetical protein TARUN_10047 [Trichoderma arundinaceum]